MKPTVAVLALVAASLPMSIDPAVHNIAVVGAENALHMSGAERALAASLGTLFIAASILATGSLGDRFGRKRVMLLGLLATLAGGLVTAAAPTDTIFLLGRSLSGIGFAASFGLSFALLRAVAPEPDKLPRAVARWLALQTLGVVAFGLVGGYLAGVSWRAAYLVAPAIGLVAFAACLKASPEAKATGIGRFDFLGLSLVAVGLVTTLYGVSSAASSGWVSAVVLVPSVSGIAALMGFAAWEWRFAAPAFPIRLFGDPELKVAALSGIAFNAGNAVLVIQLSLLWQYVYRFTPLQVSLGQMPFIVASIFAAGWAGRLAARGAPVRLLIPGGLVLIALSIAAMAFAGDATPYWMFVAPLVVSGVGLMFAQTPGANIFVAKSPPALVGALGSSRTAFGQFGFALGLALSSSLIYGMFSPLLKTRLEAAGATPAEQAQAIGILQSYVQTGNAAKDAQAVIASGVSAYMTSYRVTMLIMAAAIMMTGVLCYWLMRPTTGAPPRAGTGARR